jgi:hypothetical protein
VIAKANLIREVHFRDVKHGAERVRWSWGFATASYYSNLSTWIKWARSAAVIKIAPDSKPDAGKGEA